ncbi:urease accessorry protein UreJ [Hahella chejuensis KCTC 2396]|uniref:Urease accessorry protein UreJ n=1 Tax=Hahella chejuensis (strain KCTC 2396) TaxID=349521 RepID=Q2SDP7_HAHCH|nr:HupE/UreJ family protein [Hahella chejuensis]ABC31227.1 urease accessorry protein UreJ [Hahella chejuensis KCTC 2396]
MRFTKAQLLLLTTGLGASMAAVAHPGHGVVGGFFSGLTHPIFDLDHLVAMLGVGFLAWKTGQKARLLLAFLGAMLAGGLLAASSVSLPIPEAMITASLFVLGAALLVAGNSRMLTLAAAPLVALFAVFHGYAHVAEQPAGADSFSYVSGFILATAMIQLVGWGVAALAKRYEKTNATRKTLGAGAIATGVAAVASAF